MPYGRTGHSCALVTTKNGPGIMVAGGKNLRVKELKKGIKSVSVFDLGTETWFPAGSLSAERENFGLAVLGERIVVLGLSNFAGGKFSTEGQNVEEYVAPCSSLKECDPSNPGFWKSTGRVIGRRNAHSVVSVGASRFNCKT